MEVFMFKARTPPSILQLLPHPHPPLPHLSFLLASIIAVCFWESAWSVHIPACVCMCVCSMKGARAAEVQSLVHVLKCSPRDGPYYPCLLHQQGPGARAGSWSFVSKQMEMGKGEKKWRIGEEEEGRNRMDGRRRRGGRKSQSVLIKCCIEEDVPPQCVSNRGCSPSHSGSRSDHLYHRVCHKVCVHALGPGIRPSLAS